MAAEWSWADVKQDVKPRTDTVDLCLDGTLVAQADRVRRQIRQAKRDDSLDAGVDDLQAELELLEEAIVDATRTFDVRSCGHRRWRELLVEHQSDDPSERYDAATFVPAAIAECVVQFATAAEVVEAQEILTTAQISLLFSTVRQLNETDGQVPLLRGR